MRSRSPTPIGSGTCCSLAASPGRQAAAVGSFVMPDTRVPAVLPRGLGEAFAPSVETGTPLAPRLLAIASAAVSQATAATPASTDELDGCLVGILCAHAALEARMNQAGESLGEWWERRERKPPEVKWADLVQRLTGVRPSRRHQKAVGRLAADRNAIAHFRGVRMPDGRVRWSGPPDKARGGITRVQAHFDAARAADRLQDARTAIEAIVEAPRGLR